MHTPPPPWTQLPAAATLLTLAVVALAACSASVSARPDGASVDGARARVDAPSRDAVAASDASRADATRDAHIDDSASAADANGQPSDAAPPAADAITPPAPKQRFGMNIDPANPKGNPSAAALKAAGVRWVRIEYKQHKGFAFFDGVIAKLRAAGVRVLLLVDYASVAGAPGSGGSATAWTAYVAKFIAGVSVIAKHYSNNVDAWQIWNEPDLLHHGQAYDPGVPAQHYGVMLRDTTAAIRAHSSRDVVTAGLASGNPGFLTSAIKAAGPLTVDAVSIHPYGQRAPDNWPNASWGFGNMSALIGAYHKFGKPLWITEIGTDVKDRAFVANYLENIYKLAASYGAKLPHVFWFCWSDAMVSPYGVLDAAGAKKPAYARYRAAAGAW